MASGGWWAAALLRCFGREHLSRSKDEKEVADTNDVSVRGGELRAVHDNTSACDRAAARSITPPPPPIADEPPVSGTNTHQGPSTCSSFTRLPSALAVPCSSSALSSMSCGTANVTPSDHHRHILSGPPPPDTSAGTTQLSATTLSEPPAGIHAMPPLNYTPRTRALHRSMSTQSVRDAPRPFKATLELPDRAALLGPVAAVQPPPSRSTLHLVTSWPSLVHSGCATGGAEPHIPPASAYNLPQPGPSLGMQLYAPYLEAILGAGHAAGGGMGTTFTPDLEFYLDSTPQDELLYHRPSRRSTLPSGNAADCGSSGQLFFL
jgi:hypothetical protein